MKQPDFKININSFTLVIETFNRILDDLVKFTQFMITNEQGKPGEDLLRQYYIKSSRFYFADKFIFSSMFCDTDDIFYLPADHPKWQAIESIRTEIEIDSDEKINE